MTRFTRIFTTAMLFTMSAAANAIPLTWTLTDVTFDDGGTATGSFVFDADTWTMSDWNITTNPGNGPFHLTQKTYTTSDASLLTGPIAPGPFGTAWWAVLESNTYFHPINNALFANFRIGTTSALTNAGGVVGLDLNNQSGECYSCSRARLFVSGTLVASTPGGSVPEPSVLGLLAMSFVLMGFARRVRT